MEKDEEKTKFTNFAQALWWGVVSFIKISTHRARILTNIIVPFYYLSPDNVMYR